MESVGLILLREGREGKGGEGKGGKGLHITYNLRAISYIGTKIRPEGQEYDGDIILKMYDAGELPRRVGLTKFAFFVELWYIKEIERF